MAIRCDVCGRASPNGSVRCDCGFEFATGNATASVALAHGDRGRALNRIALGAGAIVLGWGGAIAIPVAFAHPSQDLVAIALWLLAFVLAALGVAGVALVLRGLRDLARAARLLRAAGRHRAMPEARVVEKRD
jgi:hypothetical protein